MRSRISYRKKKVAFGVTVGSQQERALNKLANRLLREIRDQGEVVKDVRRDIRKALELPVTVYKKCRFCGGKPFDPQHGSHTYCVACEGAGGYWAKIRLKHMGDYDL
jgi:hypothetical protein